MRHNSIGHAADMDDTIKKAIDGGTTSCSHENCSASSAVVMDKFPPSVCQRNCFSKTRTEEVVPIHFEAKIPDGTEESRPLSRKPKYIPRNEAATSAHSATCIKFSPPSSCRKRKKGNTKPGLIAASVQRRRYNVVNVVGGRTFPGELARKIIAGYMNPRVYPAISRHPTNRRDYWCSRNQAGSVLAKCIPRHLSESFVKSLTCHQAKFHERDHLSHPTVLPSVIPLGAKIGRTFVANIHVAFMDIFGYNNVSLERCDHMNSDRFQQHAIDVPHILEIVVMDAVLARSKKIARVLTSTKATVDFPVKMKIDDDMLKGEKHDTCFRAFLALLPEAGVFYCHRERRKEYVGVANAHVPMDINWLRIVKNGSCDNRFSHGGYVTRLWDGNPECIWKWKVSRQSNAFVIPVKLGKPLLPSFDRSQHKTVYEVHQCVDEDAPRLPPDFIHGVDRSHDWTVDERRRAFIHGYINGTTARRGCRHYVAGFLHKHIDPNSVWVIDPAVCGDTDVNVSVHIVHPDRADKVALVRDSLVQVRYLPHIGPASQRLLCMIHNHAASLLKSPNKGAVVLSGHGDLGRMYAIGTRIHLDKRRRTQYVTSSADWEQPALARAVCASAQLAAITIPGVLRVMQDIEDDSDILPTMGMAGDGCYGRVSHSMDVSVDLSNSSHYDVNDASQGFSIWTEDNPGSTKEWYFVLPNVFGKKSGTGKIYNGMAIRLTHGVLISWDGRLIRHCTSMMQREKNCHVYGTFFAAKSSIVTFGMDRKIRKHKRILQRSKVVQNDSTSASSPSTLDNSVSDDGSVPLGGDSDDGTDDEDGNDSDSSVDEGIRADLVGERIVDRGIWQDTLSKSNVAFASEFQATELPTIPRKVGFIVNRKT